MSQATVYTFDENLFSDLHKDAVGFRPNHSFFQWIQTATNDEKQAEWDSLIATMERRMDDEAEMEREAIAGFEASIATTIAAGAGDRATAIKWLMDAELEEYFKGDVEHFEYELGIPFGYIKKTAV
jgi:hypothetical protein